MEEEHEVFQAYGFINHPLLSINEYSTCQELTKHLRLADIFSSKKKRMKKCLGTFAT